jgi:hypothetical protein
MKYAQHRDVNECERMMDYKGKRTLSLDDGSVLSLDVFVCSCGTVHFELDEQIKSLPPYME